MQRYALNLGERDEDKRQAYCDEVVPKVSKTLVFIDETSAYVGRAVSTVGQLVTNVFMTQDLKVKRSVSA